MEWLSSFTNWIVGSVTSLWADFIAFTGDTVVGFLKTVLDWFASAVDSISVPDFIANYSLGTLLGGIGPDALWAMSTFRIGEGLSLIAAGYTFRLLRKLFTLGQW
jgi:hypothetical protein